MLDILRDISLDHTLILQPNFLLSFLLQMMESYVNTLPSVNLVVLYFCFVCALLAGLTYCMLEGDEAFFHQSEMKDIYIYKKRILLVSLLYHLFLFEVLSQPCPNCQNDPVYR